MKTLVYRFLDGPLSGSAQMIEVTDDAGPAAELECGTWEESLRRTPVVEKVIYVLVKTDGDTGWYRVATQDEAQP
ncbi:MAG: hypothetical protein V2A34_14005 [Lentisphaerota bacterium]